jgi:transglutaminase-like putative cysteine protease
VVNTPHAPSHHTLWLAEAALLGVTLAAVVGFARLFADASFLAPIALAAVGGHVVALALRRLGVGPVMAVAAAVVALPMVLTWSRYGGTTSHLLPTSGTLEHLGDDLSEAWDIFVDVSAPVPVAAGFVVTAMAAAWLVAVASDALAFRLNATVEALAPAAGLFLFASILSGPEHRVSSTALFLVAALGFVLAARVARADGSGRWLATDAGRGARALFLGGGILAALAIMVAVVAGPSLPGADGDPLIDLDGGGGGGDRVTISPLVDIRSRLVEQSSVEAFRVEAAAPAYWRLTALDDFDGQIWSSSGSYVTVDGRLPQTPDPEPASTRITQTFRIGALAAIWLPAAFEPVTVSSPDADVDWDADSSTLVVNDDLETSDGLEYQVLSILPRLIPGDLRAGTAGLDEDFYRRFTTLPAGAEQVANRYLTEAVGRRTSPYAQALALQNWFRDGFEYSLEVRAGHGTSALADFLDRRNGRAGYCEQFAGAYAAMARALGLPARVAVGFTPGDESEDEPGTYIVSGRHAHAWPEVYFTGAGWVPFEPTPGRGAPGAEAYTGVPAQQVTPADAAPPTTTPTTPREAPAEQRPARVEDILPDPTTGRSVDSPGPDPLTVFGYLVVGLLVLWVVVVPLVGIVRRAWSRHRARGHPGLEVAEAWQDSVRALAVVDLNPRPAETPREFARRAATEAGTDGQAHRRLADLVTTATFGETAGPAEVGEARSASAQVVQRARRLAGPWRRVWARLSPRQQLRA